MWFIPHHTYNLIHGSLHRHGRIHHHQCRRDRFSNYNCNRGKLHHHCWRGGGLFAILLRTVTMPMEEKIDGYFRLPKGKRMWRRQLQQRTGKITEHVVHPSSWKPSPPPMRA
ncbi:hypothetical protein P3S67_023079 [Capsicum chacoense]